MTFVITFKHKPVSYFYPNGNGGVKDIIGFSWKNYQIFDSKFDADRRIQYFKREIRAREDFDLKLSIKLGNMFDKMKIEELKR
jgi:hypothetical protein